MSAFVIVELSVHDQKEFEEYKKLSPISIEAYGGKFIVRGGETIPLEGHFVHERIVLLEFPSVERANEWWHSDEYSKAKKMRQHSAKTKMIIVEGVG